MATETTVRPPAPMAQSLKGGTLPRWAPLGCVAGALALAFGLATFTPISGTAGTLIVAAVLYAVVQSVWSFSVEGRRHAKDRLATTLVYSSFILAFVPLAQPSRRPCTCLPSAAARAVGDVAHVRAGLQ